MIEATSISRVDTKTEVPLDPQDNTDFNLFHFSWFNPKLNSSLLFQSEGKKNFMLREGVTVTEKLPSEVAEWRQTSSVIAEPKVFGREDDKEKIVEFLLTQARGSDVLSVYPIVENQQASFTLQHCLHLSLYYI